MKKFLILILLQSLFITGFAQESKRIIAVSAFEPRDIKFGSAVTEKVVEMLTKSKRFVVLDRTTIAGVNEELELQKSESFLDSKNLTKQGAALGADYIVVGKIGAINITKITNVDGSVGGYKAALSFQLKINETATTITTEAQGFESRGAEKALSPEKAVIYAINTVEEDLQKYFDENFPVRAKIAKILQTKNESAKTLLIDAGESSGIKVGDKFVVQHIELLNGKPYPTILGEAKVTKIAGDSFAECSIEKGGKEILERHNAAAQIECKLLKGEKK